MSVGQSNKKIKKNKQKQTQTLTFKRNDGGNQDWWRLGSKRVSRSKKKGDR